MISPANPVPFLTAYVFQCGLRSFVWCTLWARAGRVAPGRRPHQIMPRRHHGVSSMELRDLWL